ncbi:MAG: hypothetical protein AMXMBFR56_72760 [Polyangiaceae bacterium]
MLDAGSRIELAEIRAELRALRSMLEGERPEVEVVSLKDAAKRLACSERTIRRLARAGQLVLVRVGETPKVPMSELRRLTTPRSPAMPELGRPMQRRPRRAVSMPEAPASSKRYSVAAEKARLAELRAKRKR